MSDAIIFFLKGRRCFITMYSKGFLEVCKVGISSHDPYKMYILQYMSHKYIYPLLLSITIGLLVLASGMSFKRYQTLRDGGNLRSHQAQVAIVKTNQIERWMTFDYINRSFRLPSDYLKNELLITSVKYPRVTLGRVASAQGVQTDEFVERVKHSIEHYFVLIQTTP
jgi:hypothetical protein